MSRRGPGRSPAHAAAIALALLPSAAMADGTSLPDTTSVALRRGNTTSVALEANFGFLEAVDGTSLRWTCHETLLPGTSPATPAYVEGSNGLMLATVRQLGVSNDPLQSFFRSDDGCDWETSPSLSNVLIRDIALDPSNQNHVLAASATGQMASNGVWVSNDAGRTWAASSLFLPSKFFRTVLFSPTNPLKVWSSATWYMPVSAFVYRSDDGGVNWNEYPWSFQVTGTLQSQVDIIAVSPTDDDVAYARTDGNTDYLLRTTNGGMSFEPVFSVLNDIRSVTWDGSGAIWLAAGDSGAYRSFDGLNFAPVTTGPRARGFAADSRGLFAVGNNFADGYAIGLATTGTAFTPLFRFTDIAGAKTCPAGSDVNTICEPLFPALALRLGITTAVPSPSPTTPGGGDDDDCNCDLRATAESPMSGALPLAPVFVAATVAFAIFLFRRR